MLFRPRARMSRRLPPQAGSGPELREGDDVVGWLPNDQLVGAVKRFAARYHRLDPFDVQDRRPLFHRRADREGSPGEGSRPRAAKGAGFRDPETGMDDAGDLP